MFDIELITIRKNFKSFFLYLDTKFPINTSNSMLIIEQIKSVTFFCKVSFV